MDMIKMMENKIKELVPLSNYCQFSIKELNNKHCKILIPLIHETKNHLDSMYFGALSVGADLGAGLLALFQIEQTKKNIILVFKSFHADFLKRAEADISFECDDGEVITALVEKAAATQQREEATVSVNAYTDNEERLLVAAFKLTISLKEKS